MSTRRPRRNRRNLRQTLNEAPQGNIPTHHELAPIKDYLLECLRGAEKAFNQEDYDLAISFLTRAIEVTPDKAEFWSFRGTCWSAVGNIDQAIADQSRAIGLGSVDISRHSGESRNPGALESRHRSHSGYSGFPLSPE